MSQSADSALATSPKVEPRVPSVSEHAAEKDTPTSEAPESLPSVPPAADLAKSVVSKRWMALCFGVTLLVYLALIPHFILYSSPPTGDQPYYLMVTISLVEDGDIDLADNYGSFEESKFYQLAPRPPDFVGMLAPFPLPDHPAQNTIRPKSEQYDFHLPGLPLLLAPAWIIGSWFSLWWPATIVFMCIIGALVAINVFLLAHEMTGKLWIALAVWVPIAFSNPIMSYSFLIFTELPTGLLLIYAFRRLALGWGANGPVRLLLVALCIAYIPWLAWRCVPLAAIALLYGLVQWWRHRRQKAEGRRQEAGIHRLLSLALYLLPSVISAVLLIAYNLYLFGSILPPNKVPETALPPFSWPWEGADQFTQFVTKGFALLFDGQMGLLIYAPVYLLAAVGLIAIFRSRRGSDRRLLFWIALLTVPYIAILMSFIYWNGIWCPPARFLTTLLPLLAAPLAMSLYACSNWIYRLVYAALALPGLFLMAILMYDPRLLWPANPVFDWLAGPVSPLHVDARTFLPFFEPLNERTLPSNTAWLATLSVAIVLFSYLLMARGPLALHERLNWGASHKSRALASQALGWLGAISVVGAGWFVVNHEYVKPKTILYEQARWDLGVPLQQPYGIAYLGGKIYVTAFESGSVGEFDPQVGLFKPLYPSMGKKLLSWARPSDIKVSADGLLWILNNGPGDEALYVMRPNGDVVQEVPMAHKSDVAIGLGFSPDGNVYVSDMVGGRVLKYETTGGDPIGYIAGQSGGFNNVAGVVVDSDGTLFAADNGVQQVQQIDANGSFVRKFDLGCKPMQMAMNGDWIDIGCDNGLVSLNKKTGAVQKSLVEGSSPPLTNPTALVYAPDGLLYVIDGHTIVVYKVNH